ncbi:MAG: hypothetical protein GX971_02340 [Firmicutes bacterium]|nr:hypothetical protein [Bacillota bacterium]
MMTYIEKFFSTEFHVKNALGGSQKEVIRERHWLRVRKTVKVEKPENSAREWEAGIDGQNRK